MGNLPSSSVMHTTASSGSVTPTSPATGTTVTVKFSTGSARALFIMSISKHFNVSSG